MKKISALVVGCGDRSTVYSEEGCDNLKAMEIKACVDPDENKLRLMQKKFGVTEENCFRSATEGLYAIL